MFVLEQIYINSQNEWEVITDLFHRFNYNYNPMEISKIRFSNYSIAIKNIYRIKSILHHNDNRFKFIY